MINLSVSELVSLDRDYEAWSEGQLKAVRYFAYACSHHAKGVVDTGVLVGSAWMGQEFGHEEAGSLCFKIAGLVLDRKVSQSVVI